jgi:citrate lyase subunit beta / citryl-CoA lyase
VRSKLFVPASRPELFDKALAGAADAISFDLEDAVDEARKAEARELLAQHLTHRVNHHGKLTILRVNAMGTPHFEADLRTAVQAGLHVVNLPKVESAAEVREAAAQLEALEREWQAARPSHASHPSPSPSSSPSPSPRRPIGLLINIETPRGLRLAAELACAHGRVVGLQIGFGDLFSPLGVSQDELIAKQQVRWAVRLAAAEAGVPAYDGAYVHIDNPEGYRAEAQAAQRLGFAGKSCIHPSQIALANAAFRPSAEEIAHAGRVVQAAAEAATRGVGAFVVDGRLVDGPFITRAEHLLAVARRLGLLAS